MNADGLGQTRLTNNAAYDSSPAWSPDGSRIAFVSFRDVNAEIYVMSATGANVIRLTTGTGQVSPSWSPFYSWRVLVGSKGLLGTGAAGFLFEKKGKTLPA